MKDIRRRPQFEFDPKRGANGVKPVIQPSGEDAYTLTKKRVLELVEELIDAATDAEARVREIHSQKAVRINDTDLQYSLSILAGQPVEPVISYTAYLAAVADGSNHGHLVKETYKSFSASLYGDASLLFSDILVSFIREANRVKGYLNMTGEMSEDSLMAMAATISSMMDPVEKMVAACAAKPTGFEDEISNYNAAEFSEVLKAGQSLVDHNMAIAGKNMSRINAVLGESASAFYSTAAPRLETATPIGRSYGIVNEIAVVGLEGENADRESAAQDFLSRANIIYESAMETVYAVETVRAVQMAADIGMTATGVAPHPDITITSPLQETEDALLSNNDVELTSIVLSSDQMPPGMVSQADLTAALQQYLAIEEFNKIADIFVFGETVEIDGSRIKAGTVEAQAIKLGSDPMSLSIGWAENMSSYHPDTGLVTEENYRLAHSMGSVVLVDGGKITACNIDPAEVLLETGDPISRPTEVVSDVEYVFWIFIEFDAPTDGKARIRARQVDGTLADRGRPNGESVRAIGLFDTSGAHGKLYTSYGVTVINGNEIVTGTLKANNVIIDNGPYAGSSVEDSLVQVKTESKEYVDGIKDILAEDIDGKTTTFFQPGEPGTATENDLWYETDADKLWRKNSGGTWDEIKDATAIAAAQAASDAQDTADSKRRVFTVQPTTPYDIGDLWSAGPTGDLKRCKVSRVSGAYVAADWELASKYTDDTVANQKPTIFGLSDYYTNSNTPDSNKPPTNINTPQSRGGTVKAGDLWLAVMPAIGAIAAHKVTLVWTGSEWVDSSGILLPGKTTINGGYLETGTVIADEVRVSGGKVSADKILDILPPSSYFITLDDTLISTTEKLDLKKRVDEANALYERMAAHRFYNNPEVSVSKQEYETAYNAILALTILNTPVSEDSVVTDAELETINSTMSSYYIKAQNLLEAISKIFANSSNTVIIDGDGISIGELSGSTYTGANSQLTKYSLKFRYGDETLVEVGADGTLINKATLNGGTVINTSVSLPESVVIGGLLAINKADDTTVTFNFI